MCPVCQAVLDMRRHLGIYSTCHISVGLKGAQCHSEHFLGNVRYIPLQFLEPHIVLPGLIQCVYDQQRPFAADSCKDISYRAVRKYGIFHSVSSLNVLSEAILPEPFRRGFPGLSFMQGLDVRRASSRKRASFSWDNGTESAARVFCCSSEGNRTPI